MTEKAMFAAGCFWGVQFYLDQVPGVVSTSVGYSGGHTDNPTWERVFTHATGHAEVVLVEFNPNVINYEMLCKQFFRMHNPTELNRQGPDIGDNYRSAIFYFDGSQRQIAEETARAVQVNYPEPIVTQIVVARPFYVAEDFHQKFAERTGHGSCHIDYAPVD